MRSASPAPLFETDRIAARRDRGAAHGFADGADFLHRAVMDEVVQRLADVNRRFTSVALVGAGIGMPEALRHATGHVPSTILELSPVRARAADIAAVSTLDPMDLQPEAHDLVISTLELHWQNDPVGQLIQMRRALQPDGLMLATLFGGDTLTELRTALAEAEVAVTGGLSPRVAPMADVATLGGLMQRAGLAMPVADRLTVPATYPSARALMHDLRAMGETNILAARHRSPMRRAMLDACEQIYAQRFPAGPGRIRATFEIVVLTGWAPAPSQPKPKRPGSATARLADALGVDEIKAGEKTGRVADPDDDRT